MLELYLSKKGFKVSTKTLIKVVISIAIVILSVGLPQLVHVAAGSTGGMTYLPMYLPVLIGGCLLGTLYGVSIGALAPIASFLITSISGNPMPALERLPFMVAELAMFGLISGLFSKQIVKNKWMAFPAVIIAQLAGRGLFIGLVAIFQGVTGMNVSVIWNQIIQGLPGLYIQAALVPFVIILLSMLMNRKVNE